MIPNIVTKSEVRNKWYRNYPNYRLRNIIIKIVEKIGNNKKTAQKIYKYEIIELIKELGLPNQFSADDWYDYLDDPIFLSQEKRKEMNIDL